MSGEWGFNDIRARLLQAQTDIVDLQAGGGPGPGGGGVNGLDDGTPSSIGAVTVDDGEV